VGRGLGDLQRLVAGAHDATPEQIEEWQTYLVYLREYADVSGDLPSSMDWLIEDIFGSLLEQDDARA
jgi:hypothetical protein